DEGTASVHGLDVVKQADQVRRRIGLTGQYASVDEDLTGRENLVLFGRLLDLRGPQAKARADELLARFELTDAAGRRVSTYSGGMRRRLDLAASLIARPSVVYLDEPTTGLDPGKRDEVWRMIRSMTDDGGAVLLTTQYMEEADALADHIAVIDHGRLIASGPPPEFKRIVGGQTLVVSPTDPDRCAEVAGILEAVTGRTPDTTRRDVLTVPADGDAALIAAVRRLDEAGIGITELSLRLPSLDEAFFALTGRHTDDQPQDQEDAA